MRSFGNRVCASALALLAAAPVAAQTITALPDQRSAIRLSNRDINHVVCQGGEIEDVKFSAEKGLAVEKAGSDAWIKFPDRAETLRHVADLTFFSTRWVGGDA